MHQSSKRIFEHISLAAIFLGTELLASGAAVGQTRPDDTLHKLNESVDALISRVSPSVVQILVTGYGPVDSGSERGNTALTCRFKESSGSCFSRSLMSSGETAATLYGKAAFAERTGDSADRRIIVRR